MKALIALSMSALVLAGCSAKTSNRDACATLLQQGWSELSLAEADGFAGTVSYSKALSLLTAAKAQQQFEGYAGCREKADRALFYIRESREGR